MKERSVARAQVARGKEKRVFIAKPVRGKINFKALRQSIIDRFPETIAYLAK